LDASDGPEANRNEGSTQENPRKNPPRRLSAGLWVIFVLLLGALVGSLSYVVIISTRRFYPFLFRGPPGPPGPGITVFASYLAFHVILSTVSIGLLLALIAVYARTYSRTRANFVLGLLVVLFALLLQNLLTYPLLNPFVSAPLVSSNFNLSSPVADIFTIIAYTVFLYLSLE
jgi:hypothetical protein